MPINLPTNVLRSFVAIVDSGSMQSASERVFVTQPALSLQVKRLEELLHRPLFARGRRLSLTPAGKLLFDYAKQLLSLHDEAVAAMACLEREAAPRPELRPERRFVIATARSREPLAPRHTEF